MEVTRQPSFIDSALREEHEDAVYRADKQHLRPRPERPFVYPRWVAKMLHKSHPGSRPYKVGAWQALHNDCQGVCGRSGLMDHVMISLDGHLVFEPYMDLETAKVRAATWAARHGVNYSVSPVAWWNDGCVRVEFYP
jgi:hypothetical protein